MITFCRFGGEGQVTTKVMWIGTLEFDLLLGDVHSLKEKRSVVRPLISELSRTFSVSVAEVGNQNLHRRAAVGVAVIAGDRAHVVDVLDRIERRVANRPEVELTSTHRVLRTTED
jgi:uncharacterized protein